MSPLPGYADSPTYPTTEGAEPGATGQVTDHLARLDKSVALVADAANRLEQRLGAVLAVEVDADLLAEVSAVPPQRVPLADALADVEARLGRLHTQLVGLVRRCEL